MSDTAQILYSPAALEDLEGIYLYIADTLQAPQAAESQIGRIRQSIRTLSAFPESHPLVDWEPWRSVGLRKLPIGHYVAFYLPEKDPLRVTVVRIFYGGRNIRQILSDLA